MSLTYRKRRPLNRDSQYFRDDRLFIIACDDTYAPKQYFDLFRIPRIQVHGIETPQDTTTCGSEYVLGRLLEYHHQPDDERWLILDTDHYAQGTHLQSFVSTLKRAADNGVHVALSKHCFELWLLLHHVEEVTVADLETCAQTTARLRQTLGNTTRRDSSPTISH